MRPSKKESFKNLASRYRLTRDVLFASYSFGLLTIIAKVFAGNLAYATTDEGLKQFFAPVADDMSVVSLFSASSAT